MEYVGIGLMEALMILGVCSLFLLIIVVIAVVVIFLIRKSERDN